MTSKSLLLIIVLSLSIAAYPVFAAATYVPHQGDYFNYHEVESLGSGTGRTTPDTRSRQSWMERKR